MKAGRTACRDESAEKVIEGRGGRGLPDDANVAEAKRAAELGEFGREEAPVAGDSDARAGGGAGVGQVVEELGLQGGVLVEAEHAIDVEEDHAEPVCGGGGIGWFERL